MSNAPTWLDAHNYDWHYAAIFVGAVIIFLIAICADLVYPVKRK